MKISDSIRRRLEILWKHGISIDQLSGIGDLFRLYEQKEVLDLYSELLEEKKSEARKLRQSFSDFVKERTGGRLPINPFDVKRISIDFQERDGCSDFTRDALYRQWMRDNWEEIRKTIEEESAQQ